jgi:uncharacterized protein (DUF2236 family)
VARVFGVPAGTLPRTFRQFRDYSQAMLEHELAVGADARAVAAAVLEPPLPPFVRPALAPLRLPTVGLLPAPVRRIYGLSWTPLHDAVLAASAQSTRRLLPVLPGALRILSSEGRREGIPLRVLTAVAA